ncbi:MAPEG family protein [Lentilitoribacter sp. Alg239-R112]|uniref:MAPEG family protein n=1 Tax=Lentilitoribacter sp. Alg239-R112 TaxID=2305987 RepID=UPI0013A6FCDB|nr:MAPEG family protein [Lentilitoribacter sp. Alg239-R112]
MQIEFQVLLAACLLGVVHLTAASFAFKRQVGHAYTIGARDEGLKPSGLAGRLKRAQSNFLETFPIFLTLIFVLHETQGFDEISKWGSLLYIAGRVAFLPLYAAGTVLYRTLSWKLATAGIALLSVSVFV